MGGAPYKSAKEGVGTLSNVSTFNHERAPIPMSCLQLLNAIEANIWTNNNIQTEPLAASKSSPDSTQHSEWDCEHGVVQCVQLAPTLEQALLHISDCSVVPGM